MDNMKALAIEAKRFANKIAKVAPDGMEKDMAIELVAQALAKAQEAIKKAEAKEKRKATAKKKKAVKGK